MQYMKDREADADKQRQKENRAKGSYGTWTRWAWWGRVRGQAAVCATIGGTIVQVEWKRLVHVHHFAGCTW